MVSRIVIVILGFVAILTFCQNEPVSALHVEIVPDTVSVMITDHVRVTCLANDRNRKIMTISIGKSGKPPLATLGTGHPIQYGADRKPNLQAEGLINKDGSDSYLRLTIKKPGFGDVGKYSCQMYFLDGYGQLTGGKAYADMTVDRKNTITRKPVKAKKKPVKKKASAKIPKKAKKKPGYDKVQAKPLCGHMTEWRCIKKKAYIEKPPPGPHRPGPRPRPDDKN